MGFLTEAITSKHKCEELSFLRWKQASAISANPEFSDEFLKKKMEEESNNVFYQIFDIEDFLNNCESNSYHVLIRDGKMFLTKNQNDRGYVLAPADYHECRLRWLLEESKKNN